MDSWSAPLVPSLPGTAPALRLRDERSGALRALPTQDELTLYVCGITPYDATHLGHAATYQTFDLVNRIARDGGLQVRYVQNTTDIDDPLIERAKRDGVDWRDLATGEIELFHGDMEQLRVLPPDHYVGVVETMPRHVEAVQRLVASGAAYAVPAPRQETPRDGVVDYYLDLAHQDSFGAVCGWSREQMLEVYADRGGDPERAGKRDPLDPLLWRGERVDEPAWEAGDLGPGRPGWHLECTTIAIDFLGMGFTLQGGGTDLIFPHHEMSAVQAVALTGEQPFAQAYAHQGMVGYLGEKMSKSRGNLVKVSTLVRDGVDPAAIRLVLLDRHYATDWEYTDDQLQAAQERLVLWGKAIAVGGAEGTDTLVAAMRSALADDLDSPAAVAAVDAWSLEAAERTAGPAALARDAIDALFGIRL